MSEHVVAKAGGTSNANLAAVEQSLTWAESSDIFVVSAPGKLPIDGLEGDKITDVLLQARQEYLKDGDIAISTSDVVTSRYADIARGLLSAASTNYWVDSIRPRVEEAILHGSDAASMLGERLQSEIYKMLGFSLLDPGQSPRDLGADPDLWKEWLSVAYKSGQSYVLPGNTTRSHGQLVTFDRGGSDISGGLAAYGINAGLNLNLTDGCAMSADPNLVVPERLRPIPHMLYEEGRELGRNGTGLVHPAAMVPLMRGNITTEIRSTFDRTKSPTILNNDETMAQTRRGRVIALSMMKDVVIHQVHEPGMADAIGRLADFDTRLAESEVPLVDSNGAGVDGQKYFVERRYEKAALIALQSVLSHGTIETKSDVDLITLVGFNIHSRVIDHLVDVIFNSAIDAKSWQSQQQDLSLGRHSLRFSVDRSKSIQVFDSLHSHFLERP
jgi:aspartate kinase